MILILKLTCRQTLRVLHVRVVLALKVVAALRTLFPSTATSTTTDEQKKRQVYFSKSIFFFFRVTLFPQTHHHSLHVRNSRGATKHFHRQKCCYFPSLVFKYSCKFYFFILFFARETVS